MQNYLPHAKALGNNMYRRAGAHRTYAHGRKLRETPTRHLYPSPFCHRAKPDAEEYIEERPSGYRDHRRERETRLSRRSAPYMPNNVLFCIHVYRLDSVLFFSCITSVDMSCAHKISRKHLLKWNTNCLGL